MHLLHLDSSIQGDTSVSRTMSAAIVDALRRSSGELELSYRDLGAQPLPHLTLPGFATPEAAATLDAFLAADVVVIGAAMYNFGIPTQLKGWFDHILVSGKTFRYAEDGVEGLAGGKRVFVALARGGQYSDGPAAAMEHAETHLRAMLGFIGITQPEFVIAEGVAFGPDQREAAITSALSRIAALQGGLAPA
ncbi:NAD(P)H-dependent oxidoreductase [Sphingomonas sp. R647]|uniref:FMN-dependent NADH-azoreductase n=1 Tax=Sphingomonas sp. R647 TaxID=2875233 RepID=UPI001CD2F3C8|nr:NAD(P)H-dependent oxidoreductase [Sphingomonas sp. R647]MCA1199646.1 NAD(P)H-dependent oxidoreductase [Sphingomonas sp. R647]